jgi:hypothetical protein
MTVAAMAVTAADRRAIGAMFASIVWETPDDLYLQLGCSSTRSKASGPVPADTWPADRCGQVSATYHGPRTRPRLGARERYHKLPDLVLHEVTYRDESRQPSEHPGWSRDCDGTLRAGSTDRRQNVSRRQSEGVGPVTNGCVRVATFARDCRGTAARARSGQRLPDRSRCCRRRAFR